MLLNRPRQRKHIRRLVDKRIALLINHLTELKRCRNSVASISLLPNDVLSQIFFEYLLTDPWSTEWTKCLIVCHRWYDVCMGDARLWSFISNRIDYAYTWIERSKDHPLEFHYTLFEHELYKQLVFAENARRAKTLDVSGPGDLFTSFFEGIDSLPLLRQLKFKLTRGSTTEPSFHLPAFIFEGGAPELRDIQIEGCALMKSDHLTSLHNLTGLSLQLFPGAEILQEALPTLSELIQTLRQSPRLRYLNIRHYIRSTPEVVFFESVALPELDELRLDLDVDILDVVLQLIKAPSSSSLNLIPRNIYDTWDQFIHVLVLVRQHLHGEGAPVLRSLRIDSSNSFANVCADYTSTCRSIFSDGNPYFSFVVHPCIQAEKRQVFTKILNILPIRHHGEIVLDVRSNMCNGAEYLTVPSWAQIFNCIPVPLRITAGNNEGTSIMLEGLIKAMGTPAKKLKHQRILDLRLVELVILAYVHPYHYDTPREAAEAAHKRAYASLVERLAIYRDLNLPWKHGGRRVPLLRVDDIRGYSEIYEFMEQLWDVCDELHIEGKSWHPVASRNARKRRVKKWRKMGLPSRSQDEDLSEEEKPVLAKQSQEQPRKEFVDGLEFKWLPDEWRHMHEGEFDEIIAIGAASMQN